MSRVRGGSVQAAGVCMLFRYIHEQGEMQSTGV